MSKGGSIGGGKASRGVSKSKHGGGTITTTKSVARKTKDVNDSIVRLREAIFTPAGKDKDVSQGIAPAFMKFGRNGLDLEISFSSKLTRADFEWAFNLTKEHMESVYDASGYGWDDDDKKRELSEQGARFLIAREKTPDGSPPGPIRAFVHFRFTVQGEVMDTMAGDPCVYVWDIQLEESVQRKGLGKHFLMILELIGKREKMEQLCVPVQLNDDNTAAWIESQRGFGPDAELQDLVGFDSEMEGFEVYAKSLARPTPVAAPSTPKKVAAPTVVVDSPQGVTDTPATPTNSEESSNEKVSVPKMASLEDAADEEAELNTEDIIVGLQAMFREKHGRDATEEEVALWMEAVGSLTNKLDGLSVDEIDAEVESSAVVDEIA